MEKDERYYTDLEAYLSEELEKAKTLIKFLIEINQINDREMYLIEELLKYKALVSWLKQHEFYEYDVDYDWDENPVDDWIPVNLDIYVDNFLKCYDYDNPKTNVKKYSLLKP